jgi:hypothetical protein
MLEVLEYMRHVLAGVEVMFCELVVEEVMLCMLEVLECNVTSEWW